MRNKSNLPTSYKYHFFMMLLRIAAKIFLNVYRCVVRLKSIGIIKGKSLSLAIIRHVFLLI